MQPPEITFLALPFAVAFAVSMIFAPGVIAALKRRNVGQTISQDGPESHQPKAGTPTMGGLIILAGLLAGVLAVLWVSRDGVALRVEQVLAVLLLVIGYSLVGMIDDYLTINPIRGKRGIASKPKAAIQFLLAIAFVMWLMDIGPETFTPVLYVGGTPVLSGWAYWVFAVLFLTGMANFVNITDGLDGLVSGLTALAATAFVLIIALVPPHSGFEYFGLMALMMSAAGACVAFLWFNCNPARVFMGDTGSLALGVVLPAVAILTHRELLMIVIGLVYIVDGVSTVIQWAVFKYTRITTGTGRRVFKKSPIHHHFEESGWPEQKVTARFWILGIVAALIGYAGAAWRLW